VVTQSTSTVQISAGILFLNQGLFAILTSISKLILVIVDTKVSYFSRRMLHQGAQLIVIICFALLTILIFTRQELSVWVLVTNLIGLIFIEYTWDACYLCGVEMPPTELRSTALGSCSLIARVGAILAPSMTFLNTLWGPSAYVAVVLLGSVNLFISYNWLAETKGVNLDEVTLHSESVNQLNGGCENMETAKMLQDGSKT